MDGRESHVRQIAKAFAIAIASLAALFLYLNRTILPEAPYHERHPAEGLEPRLTPSTFLVETRRSFRIKVDRDFDPTCGRVSARIPELRYVQDFTRKELLEGVQSELNPAKIGLFLMVFSCSGREIGSAPVSVIIGTELAPSRNRRWVMSAGKVIYRDDSFFLLPVMVSAEEQREPGKWIPSSVNHEARFTLRDRNGQLPTSPELAIDRNTSVSEPVLVPFPAHVQYALIAFNKADGKASNEIRVNWQEQGPKLELVVFPKEVDIYAAPISSASASLYLANAGFRVKPSETLYVLLTGTPLIKSDPAERLLLTPQDPVAIYKASAGTAPGKTATVKFVEPRMSVPASIAVHILSPAGFLIAATLAGLVGVVVARGAALFAQRIWIILLELLIAAAAALLLYSANLQGWLKPLGLAEFTLSYLAAVCIGMIGGYLGLAVFKGVAALVRLVSP